MNTVTVWKLVIITGLLSFVIYFYLWDKWSFWLRVIYGKWLLWRAKRMNLSPDVMEKVKNSEKEINRIAKKVKDYENSNSRE